MRVLVTGSNGLIGQKLIRELALNSSIKLFGISKSHSRLDDCNSYIHFRADLGNFLQINDILDGIKPDVIIHLAAISSPDLCEDFPILCRELNVDSVSNLVRWSRGRNIHFIYASSDFVFDGMAGPYKETDIPNPISSYGKSKYEAELIVQTLDQNWAIFRTVLVYGTNHYLPRLNLPLRVLESLKQAKQFKAFTDQFRTPTLAEDLAKGISAMVKKKSTGIYHLSGDEMISVFEFALRTVKCFNLNENLLIPVTSADCPEKAKRPPKTGCIILKARSELDFCPTSISEGLALVSNQLNLR